MCSLNGSRHERHSIVTLAEVSDVTFVTFEIRLFEDLTADGMTDTLVGSEFTAVAQRRQDKPALTSTLALRRLYLSADEK
jgi:hypothetical protein